MRYHHFACEFSFMNSRYFPVVSTFILAINAPDFVHAQLSSQEIAASSRPAVVTVSALSSEGEQIGFGSGFFVRQDGILLTNLHVVEGADALQVTLESEEIFDNVFYVARDDRRDMIILKVPATMVPTIPVGDDRLSVVGDTVYALGSPLGFQGTFSDGILSSKRIEDGVSYLQITAPISEGSSGGPVLNADGEAIGIATLTIVDGQNINLAIPARYGLGLLEIAGEPVPFGAITGELATNEIETLSGLTLESWEQQVQEYAFSNRELLQEGGYSPLEDTFSYGESSEGEIEVLRRSLQVGQYVATGVCDDDCVDLDLAILNSNGNLVGVDEEDDAFPVAFFDVNRPGTYEVYSEMVSCLAPFCGYAIELFRAVVEGGNYTTEQLTPSVPLQQQTEIEAMIQSQGLESTLRTMAMETQTPIEIDDATTLARIEADGTQLRRTYIVDFDFTMTEEFRTLSRNGICAYAAFEPIFRARGSIREVYIENSGRESGSILVTRASCGF